ncbi:MAG: DUF2007 domain-containing protein [Bacteroidales bacterium]|nr:DUF2007 domain-containing protein [Bacteroidales bacterium]
MTNQNDLVLLFTGSEIDTNILKEFLEDNQIASLIKNEMNSGKAAGFGGGFYGAETHLYISEKDNNKAKDILNEFLKSIDSE